MKGDTRLPIDRPSAPVPASSPAVHESNSRRSPSRRGRDEAGYLLLGMILLMASTSLALGAAFTIYGETLEEEFEEEMDVDFDALEEALDSYYRDTGAVPAALADLLTKPVGVTGWMGPYLQETFPDLAAANLDPLHDAWGNAYIVAGFADGEFTIRSPGPDGADDNGSDDDIDRVVTLNPASWYETSWELRILEAAIVAYNYYPTDPEYLSGNWETAAATLQTAGYLPSGTTMLKRFLTDGWGQYYEPDGSPITSLESAGPP